MPTCPKKIELQGRVQCVLSELIELMQQEREAVAVQAENTMRAIDVALDLKFGEKERAMGALHEHEQEHGC